MARIYDPDWVIEDDEFHPDPRVAAVYADQNARAFIRQELKSRIAKLEAQGELNAYALDELRRTRLHLADTERAIKEFEDARSDPED